MNPGIYYFTGTVVWSNLNKPDDKYGFYSIDIALTPDSLAKFKELGISLTLKGDDDNVVKFRRHPSKLINNKLVEFGPPKIVDPVNTLVYRGDEVVVKVTLYQTAKGAGHRLEAVKVLKAEKRKTVFVEDVEEAF